MSLSKITLSLPIQSKKESEIIQDNKIVQQIPSKTLINTPSGEQEQEESDQDSDQDSDELPEIQLE